MSTTKPTKWNELSSDENDEEATQQQPTEEKQSQQQPRPQREKNEGGFQRGGGYNNNKQKPNIQNRSEIEKMIEDCQDEQIVLNIVKCNFEATAEDVTNTFVNFDFVAVVGYNPGSFSLTFKNKEQAKEFLYTTKETKLKERNFWIKFPYHHQKSSKIPENNNREFGVHDKTNRKFQDSQPRKNRDQYNRKSQDLNQDDQEPAENYRAPNLGFFRSDQKATQQPIPDPKQQPQQQEKQSHYPKKQYENRQNRPQHNQGRQENDDDGWETVMPNFQSKPTQSRNQPQPYKNQKYRK